MSLPKKIAVRTEALQRGRVILEEKVKQIREDDGKWREFRKPGWTFTRLTLWLMKHGYVVDFAPVGKRLWEGHTPRTYFYRREE